LNFGDFDENKNQLRPHIVWFGEEVPALDEAITLAESGLFCGNRDLLTSLSCGWIIDFTPRNTYFLY
jgi:NAD-dependent deacetylase